MFGWRRRRTDSAGRRRSSLSRALPRAASRALPEPLEPRRLLAAAPSPSGPEFPVNVATESDQSAPAVGVGPGGTFVVAWQGPDADGTGIYARRFDAAGAALGGEFAVNAETALAQSRAAVAVGGTHFVVVWQRVEAGGLDGDVYARRFDVAGAPAGAEFVVNTLTENMQSNAAVAAGADGRFVIAWVDREHDSDGPGVFARRFDPAGVALDSVEFQVNQTYTAGQSGPSVAVGGGGTFVIAWQQATGDGEWRVFVRRFGADGTSLGGETEVTTSPHVGGVAPEPVVAVSPDGGFVVTWQAPDPAGGGNGVYARRFDSAGAPSGAPFPVSTRPSEQPLLPSAATTDDGHLLITWQDDRGDGSGPDIYARLYDAAGVAGGDEVVVNTTTAGAQAAPSVAAGGGGVLVVAWESGAQDGDGTGVYARRFSSAAANDAPTTSGVAPVSVQEDAANAAVSLFDAFSDSADADSALTYTVAANTNPLLFRSTAIDAATGVLALAFAPDASGSANLTIRATDTGGLWVETTFPVAVAAVNDAPVNVVPPAQETPAGTPLVFAAVHHNRVGVDDVDAGAGPLRVTLTATGGTLTLAGTAGISFTAGDGTGDSSMTFTGSPAALNAALDGMRFDPTPGFSGAASVTISSDDQGHSGSGGPKSDTDTVAITVADELPPPAISISGATVTEPDSGETADAVFTLTLSEARPYAVSVRYGTQNGAAGVPGTAAAPDDYASASGTVTFEPGETAKSVTVAVAGDALDERDEGFSVVLSEPTRGTIQTASAAGRIVDDDPMPAMSIGDVVVAEGTDPGEQFVAEFPVTLSAPSGQQIRVVYQLGGGGADTASRRTDYVGSSGILIFEPGDTRHVISFPIVGDALDEADETFSILLGYREEINYTFADGQALATIVDDDPTPTLAIRDVTVVEGDSTAGALAELTVILSAASGQAVSVNYHAQNDTAAAPGDYEPTTGTLTFEPGETTKTVQVRVFGDTIDETEETLNVFLSAPQNATFADSRGVLRIQDDDPGPIVSVDDLSVAEGDSEAGRPVTVTVRLSAPSGHTVTVDYATAAGTAQAGSDYAAASGTVTFAPGEQVKTVEIRVIGDRGTEADETFRVVLSMPHNATPSDAGGVVTIRDDDMPALIVGDAAVAEGDAGTAQAVFNVSLSGPAASAVTVNYATADGTALAGVDYESASGVLVFQIGEMTKAVSVTVRGDTLAEPDETFTLILSGASGAAIGDGEGAGTIADDEPAAPAPRVAEVFVGGSTWGTAFRERIETLGLGSAQFGYAVPAGSAQLTTIPWSAVDQVSVRFDADVSVERDDLSLRGANVAAYTFRDFSYDAATRTATWTLTGPLGRDRVLLDLDGDAAGGGPPAGGAAGAGGLLDGEWSNGAGAFPSGDGSAGGDFEFRLNVLPGDVDRNGRVDALDLYQVRQRLLTSTTNAGAGTYRYGVFHDVTGDGRIDSLDLLTVRRGQYQSLPSGEPSGADQPPPAPPSATRELLFSSVPVL